MPTKQTRPGALPGTTYQMDTNLHCVGNSRQAGTAKNYKGLWSCLPKEAARVSS